MPLWGVHIYFALASPKLIGEKLRKRWIYYLVNYLTVLVFILLVWQLTRKPEQWFTKQRLNVLIFLCSALGFSCSIT